MGRNTGHTSGTQRGFDPLIETAGNSTAGKRRMSEEKVEITVPGIGSKARKHTVHLGDHGVKFCQTLLPSFGVRWDWSPSGNLLQCVVGRRQRANRSGVSLHDVRQVVGLIWSFVHPV